MPPSKGVATFRPLCRALEEGSEFVYRGGDTTRGYKLPHALEDIVVVVIFIAVILQCTLLAQYNIFVCQMQCVPGCQELSG